MLLRLYLTPKEDQSGHGAILTSEERPIRACLCFLQKYSGSSQLIMSELWKTEVSETIIQSLDAAKGTEYALTGINNDEGAI